jgi:predicted secreted hydrolase
MDHAPLRIPNADSVQPHHSSQWWYWSGRITAASGESFGLKLSFFTAEAIRGVLWGSMIHVALVDLGSGRCVRRSQQWLGAPRRIEGRFDLASPDQTLRALGGDGRDRLILQVGGYQVDLALRDEREPLLHYQGGAHAYDFGGYSYQYSRPRMIAGGVLVDPAGNSMPVSGALWFDRQIGALTSALYQGWQWFALHLDAGDLMLFDFNGAPSERFAVWLDAQSPPRVFKRGEVQLHALGSWQSPWTGIVYPAAFSLQTPLHRLRITPCTPDQEMQGRRWIGPAYWEGLCSVSGTHQGTGYAELVGGIAPLLRRLRGMPRLRRLLENPAAALVVVTALGHSCRSLPHLRPSFPAQVAVAPERSVTAAEVCA